MNWDESYYDHFERFLKQPQDRQIFRQNHHTPSIQILSYDKVIQDCKVFCSFGLSHYSADVGRVAEVCLPIDSGWNETPYLLASTLFFMIQKQMTIGWGISITGVERLKPQFAHTFGKSAIYFTNVYDLPPAFSEVHCGEKKGKVYLAMFISQSEHDFFVQYGAEAFQQLLEDKEVDPYDLHRLSAV